VPIYEYQCQECRHQLEVLQKMSDNALTICPHCDKPALKKLVSAASFRLKGSGWYETDFKSGNKKNLSSGDESVKKSEKSISKAGDSVKSTDSSSKTSTKASSGTGASKGASKSVRAS